jgi:hypothetical protein
LPQIRMALELANEYLLPQLGDHWRGKAAHNRGQKIAARRLKVLRCFTCHQIIARRSRLPLYDPDCGGLAWRPDDVPRLTLLQSKRGAWSVGGWPTQASA